MILDKGHSHSGAFTAPGVQAQLLHLYLEKARAVSTNSSCTQELALGTREELILCRQPEWPLSSSWQMREHHLCFCIMCFALLWSFASSVVPFGSGTDKGCADTLTSTSVVLQPCCLRLKFTRWLIRLPFNPVEGEEIMRLGWHPASDRLKGSCGTRRVLLSDSRVGRPSFCQGAAPLGLGHPVRDVCDVTGTRPLLEDHRGIRPWKKLHTRSRSEGRVNT